MLRRKYGDEGLSDRLSVEAVAARERLVMPGDPGNSRPRISLLPERQR